MPENVESRKDSRRVALLIGVGSYRDETLNLRCPPSSVAAMASVLRRPDIGGFDEVIPLIDPTVSDMRREICTVFRQRANSDLVMLYFTGHGMKDMAGMFHLTTAETEKFENGDLNSGTAVDADFIKREIRNCAAARKVVVLDCCLAASFADGFIGMDDGCVDVAAQLGARLPEAKGFCVLTAATSRKYALEPRDEAETLSVYTRYLVEGLRTGAAAPEGETTISLRNWHEYVKDQVAVAAPAMEPSIFAGQQGYDIVVAKAFVDAEQLYRKLVQRKVKTGRGKLRPSAGSNLKIMQERYKVSDEQAAAILREVLRPYEEKAKHVKAYEQTLLAEKAYAFPLDSEAVEELQEQKRLLNLRNDDVAEIEERVLGAALSDTAQVFFDQLRNQAAAEIISYPTFSFESVRVNEKGEVIEKIPGTAEYLSEDLGSGVALEMVRVPGGIFLMGAAQEEEGARKDEYPQHEVQVPEFWMGKFAVTQAQWAAVAAMEQVERTLNNNPAHFEGVKRPVEGVSWDDAVEFCKRLSRQTDREYTLPSEAQWEYACRAGTTTPFHFGETVTTDLANYRGTDYKLGGTVDSGNYGNGPKGKYLQMTTDVGSFLPNAFGLFDMHGNVWEWCSDAWHDSHKGAPTDGSSRKGSGEFRAFRGGSWINNPRSCRSACRLNLTPGNCYDFIGFRVSCSAPRT